MKWTHLKISPACLFCIDVAVCYFHASLSVENERMI